MTIVRPNLTNAQLPHAEVEADIVLQDDLVAEFPGQRLLFHGKG